MPKEINNRFSIFTSASASPSAKFSPQELDWKQLVKTLKRAVNNRSTNADLSWHPKHLEKYYLAKLRILWRRYEEKYGRINLENFAEILAYEIAEDRNQTVIAKHEEAQQDLMSRKMEFSPTRLSNQQLKLEEKKQSALEEIKHLMQEFKKATEEIIMFVKLSNNQEVGQVFNEALLEIQRQQLVVGNNAALFKLIGPRIKNHVLATIEEADSIQKMQAFAELFKDECAKLSTISEDKTILT